MSSSTWSSSNEDKERVKQENHDDSDDTSTNDTPTPPIVENNVMKTTNLISNSNNISAEQQYSIPHGEIIDGDEDKRQKKIRSFRSIRLRWTFDPIGYFWTSSDFFSRFDVLLRRKCFRVARSKLFAFTSR